MRYVSGGFGKRRFGFALDGTNHPSLGRRFLGAHFVKALTNHHKAGLGLGIAEGLDGFALFATLQGQSDRTARLLGTSDRIREKIGCPVRGSLREEHNEVIASTRQALAETAFATASEAGCRLTREQAVAYALEEGSQ